MSKRKELLYIDPIIRVSVAIALSVLSVIVRDNTYLLFFTGFLLVLMLISGVIGPAILQGIVIVSCCILTKYLQGTFLLTMLQIIPRFVFLRMLGTSLTRTISVGEMIETLERLHLPRQIIIPFTVMLRYLPTMKLEIHAIHDSIRIRGIRLTPFCCIEYFLVPILMRSVRLADELSATAVIRGIENETKRAWIYYSPVRHRKSCSHRKKVSVMSQTE